MRGDAVVIMIADESDDCRDVVRPILSPNFNITVELPLKAIIRPSALRSRLCIFLSNKVPMAASPLPASVLAAVTLADFVLGVSLWVLTTRVGRFPCSISVPSDKQNRRFTSARI
jgi:hypothetical protein